MEREEVLWEPENGAENREVEKETEPVQVLVVEPMEEEEFEIPDIPTVFSIPEEDAKPVKAAEPEHVWNVKTAKEKIKETKKKYKLEKKRLRRERRAKRSGRRALWITGLLCTILGGALGATIMWFILNMPK